MVLSPRSARPVETVSRFKKFQIRWSSEAVDSFVLPSGLCSDHLLACRDVLVVRGGHGKFVSHPKVDSDHAFGSCNKMATASEVVDANGNIRGNNLPCDYFFNYLLRDAVFSDPAVGLFGVIRPEWGAKGQTLCLSLPFAETRGCKVVDVQAPFWDPLHTAAQGSGFKNLADPKNRLEF